MLVARACRIWLVSLVFGLRGVRQNRGEFDYGFSTRAFQIVEFDVFALALLETKQKFIRPLVKLGNRKKERKTMFLLCSFHCKDGFDSNYDRCRRSERHDKTQNFICPIIKQI
jgi:hypothetical protein